MDYESEEEADGEQDGDDKDGQEGEGEEEQEEEKKDSPEVSVSSEFTEMKRVKKKKRRTKEGGEEGEEGGEEEGMSQLRVNSVLQSHPAVERYCYDYKHELWCQVGVGGDEWTRRSEVMVVCSTESLPQC